ncbi:MAG: flagellar motor switch protein FliG [Deltaproteobacteria bacterium]|nr:flagellar motor switch protein FliG [Deltaproteobacteria bacterium]
MSKDFSRMSGAEKAAYLLLCLGEEITAEVFKELKDDEVRWISSHMKKVEHVPADLARQVMEHYRGTQKKYAGVFVNGSEFINKALTYTGDEKRAESLMEDLNSGFDGKPLETISMMEPRMVADLLKNEHPQTMALILSTQKAEHTGNILEYLPEDVRSDVVYRIARIEKVSPEVIQQIEEALQREIGGFVKKDQQHVGGVEKVVEILTRMEKTMEQEILSGIENIDAETAETIRNLLFTFEDLYHIDNRGMQKILREVKNETLTLALKTAPENIREKIFQNISERTAEIIAEDLEVLGPVRLSEVERAQQSIVKIALRLEEEGQLVLPGKDQEPLV